MIPHILELFKRKKVNHKRIEFAHKILATEQRYFRNGSYNALVTITKMEIIGEDGITIYLDVKLRKRKNSNVVTTEWAAKRKNLLRKIIHPLYKQKLKYLSFKTVFIEMNLV
jgi:hypothetical protein